jgi:cytochrome c peroxidase
MKHRFGLATLASLLPLAAGAELPLPTSEDTYRAINMQAAKLGQLLFYDPILSGNKEVACATCHHPAFGTGDGLSLSIGDGGIGLGPDRILDPANMPEQRIPRNAQALWNLGAHEFTVLFHDGRIEEDPNRPGGLRTPLDADMVAGFESLLSAQSMFPVLSPDEMAGHYAENEIAAAVRKGQLTGDGGAWDLIAGRVAGIPTYTEAFIAAYPDIEAAEDITFATVSNAIASFIEHEWRSDTSPFDAYLSEGAALPDTAMSGLSLFYGKAGCADCHSGTFQTDHQFHAMGDIQIGPGKARRFETHARDVGRFGVTGEQNGLYAFRTPSLRNVILTGPYGHAGAYSDLRDYIAAHGNPDALATYDLAKATLPDAPFDDLRILQDDTERKAIVDAQFTVGQLSPQEIADLMAFLEALTDPIALTGRFGIPAMVPSGLQVPNP